MDRNDIDRDRDAGTGQFVTDQYGDENPGTTVSEIVGKRGKHVADTPVDAEPAGPESGPASESEG